MKAIRKLLAMVLVVVMVLSMSTFVFAAEGEMQPRSCAHDIVHRQVIWYEYGTSEICIKHIDFYEVCSLCGYNFNIIRQKFNDVHSIAPDDTYCTKCNHYGCV